MKHNLTTLMLFFTVLTIASQSQAALFNQHLEGTIDGSSTFGGVALGADTDIIIDAIFDDSVDQNPAPGTGVYSIVSMSLTLDGLGTFDAIPAANLNTVLGDPSGTGAFASGLADPPFTEGFIGLFTTSSDPLFSADAPSPTIFSDFIVTPFTLPYAIDLDGVAGGLVIDGRITAPISSISLAAGVPEPATATFGLLGMLAMGMRRRRAA